MMWKGRLVDVGWWSTYYTGLSWSGRVLGMGEEGKGGWGKLCCSDGPNLYYAIDKYSKSLLISATPRSKTSKSNINAVSPKVVHTTIILLQARPSLRREVVAV